MASFAAQAAIRVKWTSLVEDHIEVPSEVTSKVTSVVGWLKQASLEVRAAGRKAVSTLSGAAMTHSNQLVILHFNDVYNVESRPSIEPVGGAARFCTAMKSFDHLNPLVLFSGDAFSPSMLSTFTKGEQMVPVLNALRTQCAVLGNHDFDHGLEVLGEWVAKCQFPWLMSNVVDNETGRPLGDGRITHVIHWCGHRVGLLGLVEREWLDTLATINPDEVTFLDFIEAGQKLAHQLREEGCDYIIALTHMRTPNDIKLAEHCPDIDLILGGHDHIYDIQHINGIHIIKSGTDFRQFSKITIQFDDVGGATSPSPGGKPLVTVEEVNVTSKWDEDETLKGELERFTSMIEGKMDEILGNFSVPLDGRFCHIRTSESNLGNWVCDVMLAATGADMALINSGTFRSDEVHAAGPFSMRDLVRVLPMHEPLLLLGLTGRQLLDALENGVSQWPKLEGRFPQVAGVSFAFDPTASPRVDPTFVRIGDEYLDLNATYRVVTKQYMHTGHDGYVILSNAQVLLDDEQCPELGLAVQNHFQAIAMCTGRTRRQSKHRQSLVTLSRRHSLVKSLECSAGDLDGPPPLRKTTTAHLTSDPHTIPSPPHTTTQSSNTSLQHHLVHQHQQHSQLSGNTGKLTRFASLDDLEQESCALTPKLEQRIILLDSQEKRQELLLLRKRLEQGSVIPELDECSPKD